MGALAAVRSDAGLADLARDPALLLHLDLQLHARPLPSGRRLRRNQAIVLQEMRPNAKVIY